MIGRALTIGMHWYDLALHGDAFEMHDNAHGGNDTLIGGDNGGNMLYGDADAMF